MFSFFIAQMALREAVRQFKVPSEAPSEEIRALLKDPRGASWRWIKSGFGHTQRKNSQRIGILSTYLAGFGVLFAVLLT